MEGFCMIGFSSMAQLCSRYCKRSYIFSFVCLLLTRQDRRSFLSLVMTVFGDGGTVRECHLAVWASKWVNPVAKSRVACKLTQVGSRSRHVKGASLRLGIERT